MPLRHRRLPVWCSITLSSFALTFALALPRAAAQESGACSATITRTNVAQCAARASLSAKAEQLGVESFAGRRRAAGVFLPSNPTISVTGGHSIEPTVAANEREALWSASLSQELEIAGQRGKRLDVVAAEERSQQARATTARRHAAAEALLLYFDALAAREEARLGERLATLATALTRVAEARAAAGLAADVEARLARAVAVRLADTRLSSQTRVAAAMASLASALGADPAQATLRVEGDLSPIEAPSGGNAAPPEAAVARRADVIGALAEAEAQKNRVNLLERLRIPNPTFSVFVKNDWINERLIGVGVTIPIALPSPVGRTYAGEIAEATALAGRAEADSERTRRAARLEVIVAQQTVALRKQKVDLFEAQQIRQTEETLSDIADEIQARRLPIRDALLTQQSLIDYLFAYVEARRQLCFASVELARASGVPLEQGVR